MRCVPVIKKPRKKRDAKHNHGRVRVLPAQIVEHRMVACPDCHLRLGGISLSRVREVIDLAPPPTSGGNPPSDFQRLVCAVPEMA